jgi:subtilase family serine protease
LPLRNRDGLTNLLRQISDPASPNYRNYLTRQQFTERFGPTEADAQAVRAFAIAHGLTVTATHPNRTLINVSGSVAEIEKAFHLRMRVYRHPTENRTFFAPDAEPSLDLAVSIAHISGLDNYTRPRPRIQISSLASAQAAKPNAGSGPGNAYLGADFRAAYVPDTSRTGAGQIVGLLQFDGYTASDITYYENLAHLPSVTLTNVLLDGFSGAPTFSGGEIEVSLDIEMAISMAPGASEIVVYEAGPFGNWHDMLNRMANDNLAKQISCSWYIPSGGADPVADQIFQQMAVQGQSFFAASGLRCLYRADSLPR